MKNIKPLIFILFIVLIIWPVSYLLNVRQTEDPYAAQLSEIVKDDEFLLGLHNKHSHGCVALKYLTDVDTIIIGSSRAYASIDAYAYKEEIDGEHVAICAISSWNTDFLQEFMTFLQTENISTQRLIWIVDSAVPLKLNLHETRLKYAKAVFSDPELQRKMSEKWLKNKEAGLPILGLTRDAYENRKSFHETQINSLSLEVIQQRLDSVNGIATGNLEQVLSSAKLNSLNTKNLRTFCMDLKRNNIDLDIVLSPIPNKLSNLLSESGVVLSAANLKDFFETNTPCAQNVISKSLQSWGLDERHFMNRNLKDDYPYDLWNDSVALEAHYAELSPQLKPRFYSPDHLNAIGAHIFTKKLVSIIED